MALRILVTGASGFMARALLQKLADEDKHRIITLSRKTELSRKLSSGDLDQCFSKANFLPFLNGVDVVVHTAARAHILKETAENPLNEYRKINVDFTVNIARQALQCQVKRFIYISSIGVYGVTSERPFSVQDSLKPEEPYSISKVEAEIALKQICNGSEMELVIIRPPLVYGPNAPGNFGRMVRWLKSGIPLPLGAVKNSRSLISVDNLTDLIYVCLEHPAAAGQILLASDGEDISTPDLLRRLGLAMGKPAKLISVPPPLLHFGATILGRRKMVKKLTGSLQLDMSATTALLGWTPPLTLDEGLTRCLGVDTSSTKGNPEK